MLLSPCPPSQPRKPFTALVLLRCEQPAVVFRFPLNKQVSILTSSLEDTPPLCKPTRGGSLPALLAACLEKKKAILNERFDPAAAALGIQFSLCQLQGASGWAWDAKAAPSSVWMGCVWSKGKGCVWLESCLGTSRGCQCLRNHLKPSLSSERRFSHHWKLGQCSCRERIHLNLKLTSKGDWGKMVVPCAGSLKTS